MLNYNAKERINFKEIMKHWLILPIEEKAGELKYYLAFKSN